MNETVSERLHRTMPILSALIANPQITGLVGTENTPGDVYCIDNADTRKALILRAMSIADEALYLCSQVHAAK